RRPAARHGRRNRGRRHGWWGSFAVTEPHSPTPSPPRPVGVERELGGAEFQVRRLFILTTEATAAPCLPPARPRPAVPPASPPVRLVDDSRPPTPPRPVQATPGHGLQCPRRRAH